MPKKTGFTLIELLVAISIIAIIAGIIINSVFAIQRASRDAQRKSDLSTIQGALQQYYADQQFFPLSGSGTSLKLSDDAGSSLKSSTGNPSPPPTVKTYLDKIPSDPGSNPYCYQSLTAVPSPDPSCDITNTKCHGYFLCAKLENPPTPVATCPPVVVTNNSACANFNYVISPL